LYLSSLLARGLPSSVSILLIQSLHRILRLYDLLLLPHACISIIDKALAAEVELIQSEQANYRAERMRRRLNSCCKGLLKTPVGEDELIVSTKVQYLHRTVKDFLNRPDIWEYVISDCPLPFGPDMSLLGAILLLIKTLSIPEEIIPLF
jgi:hypothetical protein